jgi:hypothetical protein
VSGAKEYRITNIEYRSGKTAFIGIQGDLARSAGLRTSFGWGGLEKKDGGAGKQIDLWLSHKLTIVDCRS